ncbi:hypothetical protein Psta_0046 [Pirellula staleyi DSM 6068]|uniref:Uncharacterized protein n=1 Tax=Pirellula staleyi (strain ATCC 27377 / DSM 6068 / ICPB 4128) TaxID=530564 RepID=D2QZI5_PIRSD|nr:hypothetical protein [Pirellula staleyi]ADB14743.1 hypothetical protein Psta_0046 [Pirellula staleyi DSM 6068]
MTIVACPRCRDSVRIPARASNTAIVRCPLCEEEFPITEAYGQIPELEIISGALPTSSYAADDAGELNAYASPEPTEYAVAPAGDGVFGTTGPSGSTAVMPVSGVKGKIRKKKEKSAIAEMFKVVMGGVVGIGLALVVLWWGFKTDPMGIIPYVPSWAAFIVPPAMRAAPKPDNTAGGAGNQLAQNNGIDTSGSPVPVVPNTPAGGGFMPADPASGNNASGGSFGSAAGELTPPTELPPFDPLANTSGEMELPDLGTPTIETPPELGPPAELPGLDPSSVPSIDPPATDPLNTDPPSSPNPAPLPGLDPMPTEPQPLPEAPPGTEPVIYTAADLLSSVSKAAEARNVFKNADPADRAGRQELARQMYASVAATAKILPSLSLEDADNADAVTAVSDLLTSIATEVPETVVGFLGRERYEASEGDSQMLVAGEVIDIRAVGSMFECVVKMKTKDNLEVTLLSSKNPQDKCAVGDTVMVVGSKVVDPAKNVGGYEGMAPKVVTWDYGVKIAK